MTINEVKKQFLAQYMMSSEKTKEKYKGDIDLFLNVCKIKTIQDFNNINDETLALFYNYAKEQKWANSTINQRLGVAKLFSTWCFKKKFIENDFLGDVKRIRTVNKVHYTPTQEDCTILLDYIKAHTKKKRLYLMVELLLNCGFRRAEICNLKIDDVDKANQKIRVEGKGNKVVEQPVPSSIIFELVEYINTERREVMDRYKNMGGKDKGYLFLSGIGENCNSTEKNIKDGNQVKENVFYQQLKRYARKAGLQNFDKITPHALRRRFVSNVYEQTGDILIAKEAARHASESTTVQCYIDFNRDKVTSAVNNVFNKNQNVIEHNSFNEDDEYQLFLLLQKKFGSRRSVNA